MDDMTGVEQDQWGIRPFKGINFTIINYDNSVTS